MATPQDLYLAKKKAQRAARRSRPEVSDTLTITSLMDVVSIIVVYLLKSYSTDPVLIMPVGGQKVPFSVAKESLVDGVPLYVTSREIRVENDPQPVATLTAEGDVDPTLMPAPNFIAPLYDRLAQESQLAKQQFLMSNPGADADKDWDGRIILIGDQSVKFSTLVDVMATAGKAAFKQYAFCVIQTT